MLLTQAATQPSPRGARARIGLAVAGGGPLGGMYELGALRAIEDAITGVDMDQLDVYVGVSSGAFIAAGLANRLGTREMCRIFLTGDSHEARFRPEHFVRPALFEFLRRIGHVPGMLASWITAWVRNPFGMDLSDTLMRFGRILPAGIFDNDAIEAFLRGLFEGQGRTNDFRELPSKLFVIAVELDSGKTVRFGSPGYEHTPISRAIEASAALPGLYPPVKIDGKYYVDGALQRTLHASVALDEGMDLVIGINPLVPYNSNATNSEAGGLTESLVDGGLPAILSQTFRTLLQSRMQVSLPKYAHHYPFADVLLFEPNGDDVEMFFTNVFSYTHRRRVAEHAYRSTLRDLRQRSDELAPLLARHGLKFDTRVLDDAGRSLLDGQGAPPARRSAATACLHRALDTLDRTLVNPDGANRRIREGSETASATKRTSVKIPRRGA
ncbi:MAG: patatin-like phospholipase family protein [Tahibacter sp.]